MAMAMMMRLNMRMATAHNRNHNAVDASVWMCLCVLCNQRKRRRRSGIYVTLLESNEKFCAIFMLVNLFNSIFVECSNPILSLEFFIYSLSPSLSLVSFCWFCGDGSAGDYVINKFH